MSADGACPYCSKERELESRAANGQRRGRAMTATTENLIDRLGMLGEEILMVNRHMLSALQQMAERGSSSSVEIKTSARGQDVTVKAYVGSDVQAAGDAAVGEFTRIVAGINQQLASAIDGGTRP